MVDRGTGCLKLKDGSIIRVGYAINDDSDGWDYDMLGRGPVKGQEFVYLTPNKDGTDLVMHIGVIMGRATGGILVFAKLKSSKYKNQGDEFIQDYGKTGLALYGPLRDISQVRNNYGIILLSGYPFFSMVQPSLSGNIEEGF